MGTLASKTWKDYMFEACELPNYPSAVFSGILPDKGHTSGYHVSIEDNPANNHSVVLPDDKAPPGNWPRNLASAGDRSMSTTDMIRAWNCWYTVWINRAIDPRAKYFRAYNGWNGVSTAERLDFVKGERIFASPDHKWHDHREGRRRYVNDPEFKRAAISIERGETIQQYLGEGVHTMTNEIGYSPSTATALAIGATDEGWTDGDPTPPWDSSLRKYNLRRIITGVDEELSDEELSHYNLKNIVSLLKEVINRPFLTEEQFTELAEQFAQETDTQVIKDALKSVLREGVE